MSSGFSGNFAALAASQTSEVQTVVEIILRTNSYGSRRAATINLSGGVADARGRSYEPRIVRGGFSGFSRGFDSGASNLGRIETSVEVADVDNKVRNALEDADQRNSTASFYWVFPGNASDYALRAALALDTWEYRPGSVVLKFKSDDRALRTYVPQVSILPSEFPYAPASGKNAFPAIVYGSHDSSGLSGKGMTPTLCVYWVEDTAAAYCVALGEVKEVKGVYVAGVKKDSATYTVKYDFSTAGKSFTLIYLLGAETPGESDNVTVDVDGYESSGNTAKGVTAPTGAMISNPVEQMRHFLANHARGYKTGAWTMESTLIDPASWALVADWANRYKLEGARFIGGDTNQRQVLDILDDWLGTFGLRGFWRADGTLGIAVISAQWPGYRTSGDAPILLPERELDNSFSYSTDSHKLTDRYTASFLYDDVASKYWDTLDVEDPDIGEGVTTNLQMPWQKSSVGA